MNNLDWALACASKGWLVFPSLNKKPLVKWGTESTTDPDLIHTYFEMHPERDVCIKTGALSGLVVVDWDAYKQDRPDVWPLTPAPPVTYTTRTPKGGWHYYFKHPGYPVSNSAGHLAEFVDVRGDGGMVVAYPPVFACPLDYAPPTWLTPRTKEVDLGISLVPSNEYRGFTQWAEHIKDAGIADIGRAASGKRNATLYAVASDLYRLVWAGSLDKDKITQLLGDEAHSIGLEPHEIAATLASAMRNGATQHSKGNA